MMRCHRSALEWARIPSDEKVFVRACVRADAGVCVCNVIACSCLAVCMCDYALYVCGLAPACRCDRRRDCAVTAGEEMIYLSGG